MFSGRFYTILQLEPFLQVKAQQNRCGYKRYCPAIADKPEPLPQTAKQAPQVQLDPKLVRFYHH
ncbi:hypothetical protein AVDCRST_MAG94-2977 [uncultured Leptolyngbya sp.]|uniref:Uncharacterized protein n=1 Tax=uncultured Leptolyngbya sp. TaxID=332963 RepID=A0A6J4MA11_9CYAN|nr:hypothetical protein AVDCRST_MAG94-2977 [uncultured Leptolyngbya sp.]